MTTALLLIDIQQDYFPGGRMEVVGAEEASLRAGEALAGFRQLKWPVIHIQHISTRPRATFLIPGSGGEDIHTNVQPQAGEPVVVKNFPNSFRETPLAAHLAELGVKRLVIAGMMTAMCVDATTRAAFDLGFENVLLTDAMATRDLTFNGATIPASQVHGAFLAALGSIFGKLSTVKEFMTEVGAG